MVLTEHIFMNQCEIHKQILIKLWVKTIKYLNWKCNGTASIEIEHVRAWMIILNVIK